MLINVIIGKIPINDNINKPPLDTELNNSERVITINPDKKIKKRYLFIIIFSLEISSKKQEINEIIMT